MNILLQSLISVFVCSSNGKAKKGFFSEAKQDVKKVKRNVVFLILNIFVAIHFIIINNI